MNGWPIAGSCFGLLSTHLCSVDPIDNVQDFLRCVTNCERRWCAIVIKNEIKATRIILSILAFSFGHT